MPEDFRVLLYYGFAEVADPDLEAERHLAICRALGLRGRVIWAPEGLNGTVSGTHANTEAYKQIVHRDPRFRDVVFKTEPASGHTFPRLTVKSRPEVVALGEPLRVPAHLRTGKRLSPTEWREHLHRQDIVLLDGRNSYESEVGHFEGAVCPPVETFRDFPDWIRQNRQLFEGKTVLTYCTGGIRCEKLSAWMLQEGFEDVFQLDGGIVAYTQHPETQGEGFIGANMVFDDRVTVSAGERATPGPACAFCEEPTHNFVNCANVICNRRMLMCPACEAARSRCCSEACACAPLKREKGQKLRPGR